jgi:hypothetical protein
MATVHAHLDEPLSEAAATLRQVAAEQDWSLAEGKSGNGILVFRKGVSPLSWGSEIKVRLLEVSPSDTRLEFRTHELWAITDWGRGRRQVGKLLDALGAHE